MSDTASGTGTGSAHPCRIVILGGGFGGAYAARALEKKLRSQLRRGETEILLLDRNNYFVFTPLLVEAGSGSLEPRHAVVPIRDFICDATFQMAEITGVDVGNRLVRYVIAGEPDERIRQYDHLLIALGSVTRLPNVPGLREHGYEMKSLADAVALRDRAIRLLERASATDDENQQRALLHFVVVGANFTGAEVVGELQMFIHEAVRRYRGISPHDCRVTLVELGDRILTAMDDADLSEYAARKLRQRDVDVRTGCTVERVGASEVELSTGETLAAHTVIWCAGIEPSPLIHDVGVPKDERGYILCERDLRVSGFENVWSIGDVAVNPDAEDRAYPATAQHAVRQGRHVARNIAAVIEGGEATPCDIVNQGALAALGCRTGVARLFGIRLSGFAAWWMWRTVYLLKMPRLSRKLRVALDWSLDLLFSRDIVQLGVHRRR